MVKFGHLLSKEAENSKYYVKYVFWRFFKRFHKIIKKFIFIKESIKKTFLLKEHSKGSQALYRHSKGSWKALGHFKEPTSMGTHGALGYLGTLDGSPFRYFGTQALERHLETWVTQGTLFRRLSRSWFIFYRRLLLSKHIGTGNFFIGELCMVPFLMTKTYF